MNPIRIAFVSSTLTLGGAENVLLNLITGLPAGRFESRLFFLRGAGVVGEELLRRGFQGEENLQLGRSDPTVIFRLTRCLRSFHPDIVLMLDHHNAVLWGTMASRLAGVRVRIVVSHTTGRMEGAASFSAMDRMFLGSADSVVALSSTHAEYLERVEGIPARQIDIIGNGIDVSHYADRGETAEAALRGQLGIGVDERVVIMVAALRPEKAHEVLLRAAHALSGSVGSLAGSTRVKFLIVGDGERRAALECLREELGLTSKVSFLGARRDVAELLHVSDVLVLPSHPAVETLPLAVLEAMAAGVPVVASAVGSVPDIIEDGVNGRLIDSGDADGLAAAIRDILENKQVTETMVARAGETVRERYTLQRMVAGYVSLFERLSNRGSSAAPNGPQDE